MSLEDLLRNRELMMKLFWVGFMASLVFIGLGVVIIILDILG